MGMSVFSSPIWQEIIRLETDMNWNIKFLKGVDSNNQPKHLPFQVNQDRWGRFNIIGQPIAYHLTPIEPGVIDETLIQSILKNVNHPLTAQFIWALPPWLSYQPQPLTRTSWAGIEKISTRETYVLSINDNESAEDYLSRKVNSTSRRYTRQNFKKELEILSNPTSDIINEYYNLYSRTHSERNWLGNKLTLSFFEHIATKLDNAGELIVTKFNNKVVGGGILLYDQHAVHYYQGTVDREIKEIRPMHALIYRAIQQAVERKLKYINLGGVNKDNTGLDRFKRSWGADSISTSVICWESRFKRSNLLRY